MQHLTDSENDMDHPPPPYEHVLIEVIHFFIYSFLIIPSKIFTPYKLQDRLGKSETNSQLNPPIENIRSPSIAEFDSDDDLDEESSSTAKKYCTDQTDTTHSINLSKFSIFIILIIRAK